MLMTEEWNRTTIEQQITYQIVRASIYAYSTAQKITNHHKREQNVPCTPARPARRPGLYQNTKKMPTCTMPVRQVMYHKMYARSVTADHDHGWSTNSQDQQKMTRGMEKLPRHADRSFSSGISGLLRWPVPPPVMPWQGGVRGNDR